MIMFSLRGIFLLCRCLLKRRSVPSQHRPPNCSPDRAKGGGLVFEVLRGGPPGVFFPKMGMRKRKGTLPPPLFSLPYRLGRCSVRVGSSSGEIFAVSKEYYYLLQIIHLDAGNAQVNGLCTGTLVTIPGNSGVMTFLRK